MDDQPFLPFHDEVDEMTMTEYLQKSREENQEWYADFRKRYALDAIPAPQYFVADDVYEAHAHHAESHHGAH